MIQFCIHFKLTKVWQNVVCHSVSVLKEGTRISYYAERCLLKAEKEKYLDTELGNLLAQFAPG